MSARFPDMYAADAPGESRATASSTMQDITVMNSSGLSVHPCEMPDRCGRLSDVNPMSST
eukprot:821342-Pyramimonas_sp.AAC.1